MIFAAEGRCHGLVTGTLVVGLVLEINNQLSGRLNVVQKSLETAIK